jgi:hypothetical protein
MKVITKAGTPADIYKTWCGNTVMLIGDYKIVYGCLYDRFFSKAWRGYLKVNGKYKYICTYFFDTVPNINCFIRQLEYEISLKKSVSCVTKNPFENIDI